MVQRLVRDPDLLARVRLARTIGVSLRRLSGWEPQRVEVGYDEQGQRCAISQAWTVVAETEPEWVDDQRAWLLALAEYDAGCCDCGYHRSLTRNKANHFDFEVDVCPICAGSDRYNRLQDADDAELLKALENKPPETPHPGDGRKVHIVRKAAPDQLPTRR